VPTIIAGNIWAADALKNLWGPNDIRPSNPTIIEVMYPILLRHQTSGIDTTAKLRLAAIKGPTLAGGWGWTCAQREPNNTALSKIRPASELTAIWMLQLGFSIAYLPYCII
jgi:hypothetical protein